MIKTDNNNVMRGTTPTLFFTVPYPESNISVIYVTFSQNGVIVFEKGKADLVFTEDGVKVHLSQEDTLKFVPGASVEMQIRIRLSNGEAVGSYPVSTSIERILKDDEI